MEEVREVRDRQVKEENDRDISGYLDTSMLFDPKSTLYHLRIMLRVTCRT